MVNIRVELSPRPQSFREQIISELTEVMIKHGSPRDSTFVILTEVEHSVWGRGGETYEKRMNRALAEKAAAEQAAAGQAANAAESPGGGGGSGDGAGAGS